MSVSSSTASLVIVGDGTPTTNEETKMEPRSPEIKSMYVVSTVRNRYSHTIVTSKYINPEKRTQNATFSIVLPDTAFIARFVMEIKGKKYEAYVKENEEAKKEYEKAVLRGQAAAHVAVNARDSKKFTVSVNVEPQSDVTFILTYEELLVRKHSMYEIVVNLHPGQLIDDLKVDIHINEMRPITHVAAPALRSGNEFIEKVTKNEHAIISKNNDGMVHVSFNPTVEQQKEMARYLRNEENIKNTSEIFPEEGEKSGISGQFVVEYDVERDSLGGEVLVNDGYFVHFFAPTELKPIPKHVIFVLDVSGSMGGRKLKQLKAAMKVILKDLNSEDYFNIVKFSYHISVLSNNYSWENVVNPVESELPQSFPVNAKSIQSAQDVVEHIIDDEHTNLYDALIVGLRLASKEISHLKETDNKYKAQPIIVFLTDGEANTSEMDPTKILEMVEKRNTCGNKSAIFTLAFGENADSEFLRKMAIQNSGFLKYIYEDADASLQLQNFYKQISSPLLTNINFTYPEKVKKITKQKFDILFDGSEFVVAGQVDDGMVDGFVFVEGFTVSGNNKFCPTIYTICLNRDVKEEYGSLKRLWAYITIKQLLDKKYEKKASDEAARKQALKLALKYSFVTPVTSMVVFKPDEPATEDSIFHSLLRKDVILLVATPDTRKSVNRSKFNFQRSLKAKELICKKGQEIAEFFTLPKYEHIMLIGLDVDCPLEDNIAKIREKRTYFNRDNKPHQQSFTLTYNEELVFLDVDIDSPAQKFITYRNGQDNTQAKKGYREAVSKGLNAVRLNVEESNKFTVTIHAAGETNLTFTLILMYKNYPGMENDKSTDSPFIGDDTAHTTTEDTTMEPGPPKMKSMHVVSNIRNRYARTVITSKYTNPDTCSQETTFSIVLPDTAFIAGFVMEIKGKKYEAYVKEKEEAKLDFEQAIARNLAAANVAVNARDSNKFSVSVNVEQESDVTFILTYEELLVRKHSKYEMVVNLYPGQLIDDLKIDIHINETRPIIYVETPAIRSGNEISDKVTKNEHATIIRDSDGLVHVSFQLTINEQKEIASNMAKSLEEGYNKEIWEELPKDEILGQFVVEYGVESDPLGGTVLVNDGYFVHFFAPTELKPIPKHIIFVLDVSLSMGGRKMEQLKDAMKIILSELNPDDYFNIVTFSTSISVLNCNYLWKEVDNPEECELPQSFKANSKNIQLTQAIIDDITDQSETNIKDALIVSLRLTSRGILDLDKDDNKYKPQPMIVFLTDGQPNVGESSREKIIEIVEKRNDCDTKSSIFTLAFGEDADIIFLKELAIQNLGFLRIIYEAADSSLQLQDFYKQISSPLLTNVNFKYPEEVKEVTNRKFDILFDGSEFVIAGRTDDMVDGFVFVEGSTVDGKNKFCPIINMISSNSDLKEEYGSLERLWAYLTIKQLQDKEYEKEVAKKQALELALKYSFVTPVTSLVIVKPDEPATEGKLNHSHDSVFHCLLMKDVVVLVAGPDRFKSFNRSRFNFMSSAFRFPLSSEIKDLIRKKGHKIAQFFTKSKVDNYMKYIGLKSIKFDCTVEYNMAKILETRKYINSDDNPHEEIFTIVFPEEYVFVEIDIDSPAQKFITCWNGQYNKLAKRDYNDAVSKGVNAVRLNIENSNKITVKIYIAAVSEISFTLIYNNYPEMKNSKYEIVLNLDCEACTDEITVDMFLKKEELIKNIPISFIRNKNGSLDNKYATINKSHNNEAHIAFHPTTEQQAEIITALNGTDGIFSGQFVVEYERKEYPMA